MSARIIGKSPLGAGVSTVGTATSTVATTENLPNGSAFRCQAWLLGRDTTSGEVAHAMVTQQGKVVGGVLSLTGSIVALVSMATGSEAALATAVVAFAVSGTGVALTVTGVIAKTIEWSGSIDFHVN